MQKCNVHGALTGNNNWPLWWEFTAKFQVHQQPAEEEHREGEMRMRLTSGLVLMFEHKHRPKTKKHRNTIQIFYWSRNITKFINSSLNCDWGTLTFLRHPFRWLGRGGRVERMASHHSAGTASLFAATGRGRDEDDGEERWAQTRRIKLWCCH